MTTVAVRPVTRSRVTTVAARPVTSSRVTTAAAARRSPGTTAAAATAVARPSPATTTGATGPTTDVAWPRLTSAARGRMGGSAGGRGRWAAMTLTDRLPADPPTPTRSSTRSTAGPRTQGLTLYPAQEEALIEVVTGANVILATPTGSGKSLVATGAHFAALAAGPAHLLHRADQGAGVGEVLRAVRGLRRRERRHADRRRGGQRAGADHLLHRRGARQHRAARGRRRPTSARS